MLGENPSVHAILTSSCPNEKIINPVVIDPYNI